MEPLSQRDLLRHELETRKYLVRNYLCHAIEGGLYMGGMAFVAETTILPVMVKSLNGPSWLVAAVPVLMGVGCQLPSLLVAHWIERLHWVKAAVMTTGVLQRVPYLLTGLLLIFLGADHPRLALAAVALCPLVAGLSSGVTMSAWWELVAKTIPPNRRSSLWAARYILTAAIGMAAGVVVHRVLGRYPGTTGFGILHLIAVGLLAASYLVFAFIKETTLPARPGRDTPTLGANLRAVPALVAGNRSFRLYLGAVAASSGLFLVMPFLAIHGLRVVGKDENYVGVFLTAQMIGGLAGNVLAGFVGDRWGGKVLLLISRAGQIGVCLAMLPAREPWQVLAAFALFGAAQSISSIGGNTLGLEVCPLRKRATYLAIMGMTWVVFSPAASGLGALTWELSGGSFAWLAGLATAALAGSMALLWRIEEPRRLVPAEDGQAEA